MLSGRAAPIAMWVLLATGAGGWCGSECAAQPAQEYVLKSWEVEDGLPGDSATAIVQTGDGYLWIGSFDGLVRFDGARFELIEPREAPGLAGARVVGLHLDSRGRLWVSTLDGVFVREGSSWRSIGSEQGWIGDGVRSFAERSDGAIIATTFDGRFFEWDGRRFEVLPRPPGQQSATCASDFDGRWWVARPGFVGTWDGRRWIAAPGALGSARSPACAPARDGGVWVLADGDDLRKFRGNREVQRLAVQGLPNSVWGLYEDSLGRVWVATHDAGVYRVTIDGTVERWDTSTGLPYDGVRFVFEDRERNLWVGMSGGGLSRLTVKRVRMYGAKAGLTERVVNSVWPMADGGVLVGTYGQGLFELRSGAARPVPLPTESGQARYVQSVLEDTAGRWWIGTYIDGLFIREGSTVRRVEPVKTGGSNVIALHEDSTGRVWVSGGQSVAVFRDGEPAPDIAQAIPVRGVCAFAEDPGGDVLLSNTEGVFSWSEGRLRELLTPDGQALTGVMCMRPEADGTVWMGTSRSGLLRWRPERIDVVDGVSGLPARSISGIMEDPEGHWWMASERGIIRVSSAELRDAADGRGPIRAVVLGVEDGMAGRTCSRARQPICGADSEGRLWFATPKGVASVDPGSITTNEIPPPVVIESVAYQRLGGEVIEKLEGGPRATVRIPAGGHRLEIRYAGLSFSNPGEVRFETKLEGIDREWRDAGVERSRTYHELGPGDYVFRVRASNDDGVWSERDATVRLSVLPFIWQTGWFLGLAGLSVVGLSATGAWSLAHARFRLKRQGEERFRRVVEAAPNAMVLVDGEGRIALVNAQAEKDFQYGRDELMGRPIEDLLPERLPRAHEGLRRAYMAVANPRPMGAGHELFGRRKDGSEFPVEIGLNPMPAPHGVSVLASIIDVSERNRAELELATQRNELAHLSRVTMLGELSGSLAHELNQPLTAILSNAQAAQRHLSREQIDMQEVREILADIVEQDKRAGEVIHRLRALLQKGESKHAPLDMSEVITDVLRLMRSDLINHGVNARFDPTPDLPEVMGDRVQLQQVLLNLLINACDSLMRVPRESRRLDVTASGADGEVRVCVCDRGPGFASEVRDRLFEPFFTTKAAGTGLGLAICRTIMQSHGGRIWAEDNASGGATFCLALPTTRGSAER